MFQACTATWKNVADTYNSLALGNFSATWSRNLRPQLWSDGLDAAEEPPAWKQLKLKRCTLNHPSVARDKRETDSALAMIAFQCTNSLVSAETLFLKLIITQRDLGCVKRLYESAEQLMSLDGTRIPKYWTLISSTVRLIAAIWFAQWKESRGKKEQHTKEEITHKHCGMF